MSELEGEGHGDGRPQGLGLAPGAPALAAGQDAAKYATTNPVVLRLIDRWLAALRDEVADALAGADRRRFVDESSPMVGDSSTTGPVVVDVGAGEGLALERFLPAGTGAVAAELRPDKLAVAVERLAARDMAVAGVVADAGLVPVPDGAAPVVSCIEVLEHLTDPGRAVAELARITGGTCVVSVPWEPWFRLGNLGRGKNLRRLGNDPEHVQAFTPGRLHRLLAADFAEVRVRRRFPWLLAVAR